MMTLLNRYSRQQRLNPAEVKDPAMRSMMDAVRQVYINQAEEQKESEEAEGTASVEAEVPAETETT
jgi:hypothetical protein|tara:strand:+ start:181 stop:378 length:198 start_codon:yes stop_codon:yes gene_type:complete